MTANMSDLNDEIGMKRDEFSSQQPAAVRDGGVSGKRRQGSNLPSSNQVRPFYPSQKDNHRRQRSAVG